MRSFLKNGLVGPSRRFISSSTEASPEALYTAQEVTALAASVWIAPLVFAFSGGMWLIHRSDSAEAIAKQDRSEIKVLSPTAYFLWRKKDPALMDFQMAREQLGLHMKSGLAHEASLTYDQFASRVSAALGKPKEPK